MNTSLNKNWISLSELPGQEQPVSTLIPLKSIDNISFIEAEEHEYHIFVTANNIKYLLKIVETHREAEQTAASIANDVEDSKD